MALWILIPFYYGQYWVCPRVCYHSRPCIKPNDSRVCVICPLPIHYIYLVSAQDKVMSISLAQWYWLSWSPFLVETKYMQPIKRYSKVGESQWFVMKSLKVPFDIMDDIMILWWFFICLQMINWCVICFWFTYCTVPRMKDCDLLYLLPLYANLFNVNLVASILIEYSEFTLLFCIAASL